jgi:hypothetical protein
LNQKGLSLIAQFNFQRAAGCCHPKILLPQTHVNFPFRGQKTECRFTAFRLGISGSSFGSAEIISTAPTVNLVFVFQSPSASVAKDSQNIRSEFTRKRFLNVFLGALSPIKSGYSSLINLFRQIPNRQQFHSGNKNPAFSQISFHASPRSLRPTTEATANGEFINKLRLDTVYRTSAGQRKVSPRPHACRPRVQQSGEARHSRLLPCGWRRRRD